MVTVEEAKTSFKNLSAFVYERVTNYKNCPELQPEQAAEIDEAAKTLIDSVDDIHAKVEKLMNVNILDRNVSFKVFEKLPYIWDTYFTAARAIALETTKV